MNDLTINYNQKSLEIAHRFKELFREMPMFYQSIKTVDILFIGINPSRLSDETIFNFVKKHLSKHSDLKSLRYLDDVISVRKLFSMQNEENNGLFNKIQFLGELHELFFREYQYFIKFKEIQTLIGNVQIGHLDLFNLRETDQKKIKKLITENPIYVDECVNLFIDTLQKINPKVIIVENSLARDLLLINPASKSFFPDFKFESFKNNHFGTPTNRFNQGIIYSSMLTGQRALDNGSFHRLVYTIDNLIKS